MGRIAKILSFVRSTLNGANVSDVKVDPGGGANATAEHFSAPGDDSFPLTTDMALTVPHSGSGRTASVGYLDPINTPLSIEGDKRIYSRDPLTGVVAAEIWLKGDKSVIITNGIGIITMLIDGSVNINGLIITPGGAMVSAAGISSDAHTHAQVADSAGDTQANTGVPL